MDESYCVVWVEWGLIAPPAAQFPDQLWISPVLSWEEVVGTCYAVWEVFSPRMASLLEVVDQKQLKKRWFQLMAPRLVEVDSCCAAWTPGLFIGRLVVAMDRRRSLHIGSLLQGQRNNVVSEDWNLRFTLPLNVPLLFAMPVDYEVSKL